MESTNHTPSLISGLLLGALAGAALGVLFAPHKGSKTRSNILEGTKDITDNLKKKMNKEVKAIRRKAKDLENATKAKFEEMKDNSKIKADTL